MAIYTNDFTGSDFVKEYDTLRAEIIQRLGHRIAFLALTGAVGVYAFFRDNGLTLYQYFVIAVAVVFMSAVWLHLGNVIGRCSRRIAEIELQINAMAGEVLLRWEHEQLGSKTFHRVHRH